MDRSNFDRFMLACQKDANERYKLLWLDTCKTYTLPLPKVIDTTTLLTQNTQIEKMPLGVYVDVFIYDSIPTDERIRKRYINRLDLIQRFWGYSQNKYVWKNRSFKSILRFIVYKAFHLINPRFFSRILNNLAPKYNNCSEKTAFIGSMVYSPRRYNEMYAKEFFDGCILAEFENDYYMISSTYDEYLVQVY